MAIMESEVAITKKMLIFRFKWSLYTAQRDSTRKYPKKYIFQKYIPEPNWLFTMKINRGIFRT
jgi:hypothetical protein